VLLIKICCGGESNGGNIVHRCRGG
jgi:hypothetical protein